MLIFLSVIPLIQDSGKLLMLDLGSSNASQVRKALAQLSSVQGLSSYGAPRFWPKDPDTMVGSIHIQLQPSPSSLGGAEQEVDYKNVEKVVAQVDSVLRKALKGLDELSIQVEPCDGLPQGGCFCLL